MRGVKSYLYFTKNILAGRNVLKRELRSQDGMALISSHCLARYVVELKWFVPAISVDA